MERVKFRNGATILVMSTKLDALNEIMKIKVFLVEMLTFFEQDMGCSLYWPWWLRSIQEHGKYVFAYFFCAYSVFIKTHLIAKNLNGKLIFSKYRHNILNIYVVVRKCLFRKIRILLYFPFLQLFAEKHVCSWHPPPPIPPPEGAKRDIVVPSVKIWRTK